VRALWCDREVKLSENTPPKLSLRNESNVTFVTLGIYISWIIMKINNKTYKDDEKRKFVEKKKKKNENS
jgi:hypothetical protein